MIPVVLSSSRHQAGGKGLGAALWQLSHCGPAPSPSASMPLPCGFFPNAEARGPGLVLGHCSNLLCTGMSVRDGGHSRAVYLYKTGRKQANVSYKNLTSLTRMTLRNYHLTICSLRKIEAFFSKDLKRFYWLLSYKIITVFNSWRTVSENRKNGF